MKTKMILSFALLAMLAACSNNDNVKPEDGDKGKVDITQGIEFKVNFKDFNTEKEYAGTRTAGILPLAALRSTLLKPAQRRAINLTPFFTNSLITAALHSALTKIHTTSAPFAKGTVFMVRCSL